MYFFITSSFLTGSVFAEYNSQKISVPELAVKNNTIYSSEWNKMVSSFEEIKKWGISITENILISQGKIQTPSTESTDDGKTLVTKDYVDSKISSGVGNGNSGEAGEKGEKGIQGEKGDSFLSQLGAKISYLAGDSENNAEISLQTTGTSEHWGIYHDFATESLKFWNGSNLFSFEKDGTFSAYDKN